MRSLARSTPHTRAYDLHGADTEPMVKSLNAHLEAFGVRVLEVAITDVVLPREFEQAMSNETTLQVLSREESGSQKFGVRKAANRAAISELKQTRTNERKQLVGDHEARMAELEQKINRVNRETLRAIAKVEAEGDAKCREIGADSNKTVAELRADVDAEVARILAEGDRRVAQARANMERVKEVESARATAEVSKIHAEAETVRAQVEAVASEKLRERRQHRLDVRYYDHISSVASNEQALVGGAAQGGNDAASVALGTAVVDTVLKATVRA